MTNNNKATLRLVRPEDEAFLCEVYASARAEELALTNWNEAQREAFIKMQFAAQLQHYRSRYPEAEHQIILLNDLPVGRIYVDRRPTEIRILDITILPEYRNLGIGAPLIEKLLAEAAETAKTVSIYIENYNRSQRLFARLGFSPIEDNGFQALMEWRPI
ncbi:MAG TPA: GNAT family N-acetyltransferase [Blastocatellia bacterium]|nr:GNAT family N-acetyltransferase [Blastocatellia bacterium]